MPRQANGGCGFPAGNPADSGCKRPESGAPACRASRHRGPAVPDEADALAEIAGLFALAYRRRCATCKSESREGLLLT